MISPKSGAGGTMGSFRTSADFKALEAEATWSQRDVPRTIHEFLSAAKAAHGDRPAVTFQLQSEAGARAQTLTWTALHEQVTRAANLFRSLGVGPGDVVAYVLPNCLETVITLLGGAVAGIVNPVNPLLESEQIASILRETRARVVVTLRAFPKTELPQRVAAAVAMAPGVQTVVEVDLAPYLGTPKSWIAHFLRPRFTPDHQARVIGFAKSVAAQSKALDFVDDPADRVAACFHTGGTTGLPKVAQHLASGMIYNGWCGKQLLFVETDVVMCPMPLFHVFAAYPILMSMIASGGHVIFPTPAGYRGDGVFDNMWALIERWQVTYLVTVPTALSALLQRPVNARIDTLRGAFSGSAPLPIELYNRFEKTTGVQIVEGYGLTECTCLVSVNPPEGTKKIGSVGLAFPYTHIRILKPNGRDGWLDCAVGEVGEICVASPGVTPGSPYTEPDRNKGLFAEGRFLRTGDLGRLDSEGYLFITGRAKDLIIRGGHNIDPSLIEEALMGHDAVAFVGAIGQPDLYSGEVPCAYVELITSRSVDVPTLLDYARDHITERAAIPKYIEILSELPKTAVGKVLKPELRKRAIARVLTATLVEAGLSAEVREVVEDKTRGLVAMVAATGVVDQAAVATLLGSFATAWDWAT